MRQLKITKSITNRDSASLEKYLHEISSERLIDADEEVQLAQKIKAGDEKALDKLIRANLRFVISVAKQYQNQGLPLSDLIGQGNLGLIKAAQRFDETRGFKFISYAVWWIRQSILQSIAEQSRIVRIPLNKIGARNKVNKMSQKLEQELQREPTNEEISEVSGLSLEDVSTAIMNNLKQSSLDFQPGNADGDINAADMYEVMENKTTPNPDKMMMDDALRQEIERALRTLTARERDVLKLFFGLNEKRQGLTLEEIGEKFELTRERVRQIKEKAIRRLKHTNRSRLLRAFLG